MRDLAMPVKQVLDSLPDLPAGTRLLIGVSGGSDSIGLLTLMRSLAQTRKWQLGVAHVEHGLRGADGRADAVWVRRCCRDWQIPVHVCRPDVRAKAEQQRVSVEMAARSERLACFKRLASRHRYAAVVLAHTADDQAETLLYRLIRGTSLTGLGGMQVDSRLDGLRILRPLLSVRKKDVQTYLRQQGVTWREDVTNQSTDPVRNRIRHRLLPLLRDAFNPAIVPALARTASLVRDDEDTLNILTAADLLQCERQGVLDVAALQTLPLPRRRRVLMAYLQKRGAALAEQISFDMINRCIRLIDSGRGSAGVPLVGEYRLMRQYNQVRLVYGKEDGESVRPRVRLPASGARNLVEWGLRVVVQSIRGVQGTERETIGQWPATATLAAARVGRAGLYMRSWQDGDTFHPLGAAGRRKIQDIWVDRKVPKALRRQLPLVTCRGEVVWIPGYTIADGYALTSAKQGGIHLRLDSGNFVE